MQVVRQGYLWTPEITSQDYKDQAAFVAHMCDQHRPNHLLGKKLDETVKPVRVHRKD